MLFLETTIFGLPAHPLIVHAAVVLIPLSALAFAALAWRSDLRQKYLPVLLLLAVAGAGGAILAAQTGEPLEESVREAARDAGDPRPSFGEHPEQGDRAEFAAITLALAVGAVLVIDSASRAAGGQFGRRQGSSLLGRLGGRLPAWAPTASYAIALIPAVLAVAAIVAAGHSGAELVWKDVGVYAMHG